MKYRIIKAFVAVCFSVCIVYSTVKMAYHSAIDSLAGSNTEVISESKSAENFADNTPNTEPDTMQKNPPNTAQNNEQNDSDSDSREDATEITESGNDAPSLDEYLSKLTCGGCGRNCSLLNPRCHNGMRKANEATQSYYSNYQ